MRLELAARQVERIAESRRAAGDQVRLGEDVAQDGAPRRQAFPEAGSVVSPSI
jgi:hypothetical protein